MEKNMKPCTRKSITLLNQWVGFDTTEVAKKVFSDIIPPYGNICDCNTAHFRRMTSSFTGCLQRNPEPVREVSNSVIGDLQNMTEETDSSIRNAAYVVFKQTARSKNMEQLLGVGLIPDLIRKLPSETEANQVLILETLQTCCASNPDQVLRHEIMGVLKELAKHSSSVIRCNAIAVVNVVCLEDQGKSEVCEAGWLPLLSEMLTDEAYEVQIKVLETVISIAEAIPGTLIARAKNIFVQLSQLLKSEKREIVFNALKVFEALVSCPRGKRSTLLFAEQILSYDQLTDPGLRKVATNIINTLRSRESALNTKNKLDSLIPNSSK